MCIKYSKQIKYEKNLIRYEKICESLITNNDNQNKTNVNSLIVRKFLVV